LNDLENGWLLLQLVILDDDLPILGSMYTMAARCGPLLVSRSQGSAERIGGIHEEASQYAELLRMKTEGINARQANTAEMKRQIIVIF